MNIDKKGSKQRIRLCSFKMRLLFFFLLVITKCWKTKNINQLQENLMHIFKEHLRNFKIFIFETMVYFKIKI